MAFNPIKLDDRVWKDWLSTQEARLPALKDVEQITDRVLRILGGNPGEMQLQGTSTYLVGTGRRRILVDTGEGKLIWARNITQVLQEHELDIAYVLLTHWHGDHTGGVPDLIAHDPALADKIYKHTPDPGQQAIFDGDIFSVDGATMRAVHTPGHALDHMCFVLEEEDALFTGDNVLGHGYSVEEDLGDYMHSLHRMRNLGCLQGYPAHGIKIEDLPRKMNQYIHHKEFREGQVINALRRQLKQLPQKQQQSGGGSSYSQQRGLTVVELMQELHGDLPSDLVKTGVTPFVLQVLKKLAEERKVGFAVVKGDREWFLKERRAKVVAVTGAA